MTPVRFDGSQAAVCATSPIFEGHFTFTGRSVSASMGEGPLRNQLVCRITRSKKARDSWWAACVDVRGGAPTGRVTSA